MKIKLGIIVPFLLQIGVLLMYQAIRYQIIDSPLLVVVLLTIFPSFLIYVWAPFILIFFLNLKETIGIRLNAEYDKLIGSTLKEYRPIEESRTMLNEKGRFNLSSDQEIISDTIKSRIIPQLTAGAITTYKDNYYSRDLEIHQERSVEYFEALTLFSILTGAFFLFDLILVWIMALTSIDLYFIVLDQIEEIGIVIALSLIFIILTVFSLLLFFHTKKRLIHFIPYVVPIAFNEDPEEQYIRRESIRSILDYNFDNIIDRSVQRKHSSLINDTMSNLIQSLLRDELIISSRTQLARKLAWKEYSRLIVSEEVKKGTLLELLLLGEPIAGVRLNDEHLIGLNSDYELIQDELGDWKNRDPDSHLITYFRLYRVIEFVFREISNSLSLISPDEEYNFFKIIKILEDKKLLSKAEATILHNLRQSRNQLMHEPGVTIDTSRKVIEKTVKVADSILGKMVEKNKEN